MRHVIQRIDPRLSDVLNQLDGTAIGTAFFDRVKEFASSAALGEPVNRGHALVSYSWLLERAAADELPLTAAGYLRPAAVIEFAEVLPTMRTWIFHIGREIDTKPVLYFRESLQRIKLLRKYKGHLLLTRAAHAMFANPELLWAGLAERLIPSDSEFVEAASVIILVYMATSDGRVDMDVVARSLTQMGWALADGDQIDAGDVWPVYNELWELLGNVGDEVVRNAAPGRFFDRKLSREAIALAHDALFTEVSSEPTE